MWIWKMRRSEVINGMNDILSQVDSVGFVNFCPTHPPRWWLSFFTLRWPWHGPYSYLVSRCFHPSCSYIFLCWLFWTLWIRLHYPFVWLWAFVLLHGIGFRCLPITWNFVPICGRRVHRHWTNLQHFRWFGHPEVENVFISQIVAPLTVPIRKSLLSGGVATVGRHLGDDPSHWGTFWLCHCWHITLVQIFYRWCYYPVGVTSLRVDVFIQCLLMFWWYIRWWEFDGSPFGPLVEFEICGSVCTMVQLPLWWWNETVIHPQVRVKKMRLSTELAFIRCAVMSLI